MTAELLETNIHNAAVFVWDIDLNGDVVLQVVDVDYFQKKLGELPVTKAPCGMSDDHPEDGDDPRVTAVRELEEETGLVAPINELVLIHAEPMPSATLSHNKFWFAVPRSACKGTIRKTPTIGKRAITSAAYEVPLDDLHRLIVKTHQVALRKFEIFVSDLFALIQA